MKDFFDGFDPVPWLVPAAELPKSPKNISMDGGLLDALNGLNVAALVPAITNEPMDIGAYDWPSPGVTPAWKFEVRARSNSYSMNQGMESLVRKCKDTKSEPGLFHGMLIGVRDEHQETEISAWFREDREGNKYLRIIILLGRGDIEFE